jgi:DNA-binding transcriptional ArsR family regulator
MLVGAGLALAGLVAIAAGGLFSPVSMAWTQDASEPDGSADGLPAVTDPDEEVSLDPSATPEAGDDVRVIIDGGESFIDGTLEAATEAQLILRVAGVVLPLNRDRVVSVVVRLTPSQRYRDIRPSIDDEDFPRLISLVRWLEQNRLYDEALRELEGILRLAPDNDEAQRLKRLIEQLVILEQIRAERRRETEDAQRRSDAPARERAQMPDRNDFPPLNEEQINLIKVYELDLGARPKLVIQRSTVDELLKRYAEHPLVPVTREGKEAFYRKSPVEIMDVMFRVSARDLYGQVRVIGQPESMEQFRNHISARWLTNRCATTRCHGGNEAGRLRLLNRAPNSEATVYTNFLLLDRFDTQRPVPMIDYTNPGESLLLQMALPREDVLYPHPDVPGWRPVFLSNRTPQYRAAVRWMRMMYQPRPDYPIEYDPFAETEVDADGPGPEGPDEEPAER